MDNKEKKIIKSIIKNYRSMRSELESYENILTEIENGNLKKEFNLIKETGDKIKSCIERLNKQREDERNFFYGIAEKYGPGDFNPVTFEYKPRNEK